MERLTERTAIGILVKENYEKKVLKTLYSCYGEKPNSHYTNCEEGYCAMEKLATYEDLEEQGLLLRLPCRAGTIVYVLQSDRIIKVMITRYDCFKDGSIWFCFNHGCGKSIAEFGKTVFLTREEAETRLRELMDRKEQ